ncbi:MAG: type II toxin-antitoxin system RelB/DinJ family antitoxin [Candidatus Falkowbacteria bacterium]|nr:type II toxin-antitoxin system RelB/DinJ family antitoxin [Candidatus Falkowbacteria bacterium]
MITQLQVRVDAKQKKNAQKILNNLGLDLSMAIRMFIIQIGHVKGLPFEVRDENCFRPHKAKEMLKPVSDLENSKKGYVSVKALMRDLAS